MKHLILLLILLFTSCKGDFGKKVSNFVDNEVPQLSSQIADSGFKRRMHEGYFTTLMIMAIEVRTILKNVDELKIDIELTRDLSSFEKTKLAYLKNRELQFKLMRALSDLLEVSNRRKAISDMCDNGSAHDLQGILEVDMFSMTIPEKAYSISGYDSWEETAIRNVIDLFSNENTNQQVGVMEAAIYRIPNKIVSKEKLKVLFKENCELAKKNLEANKYIEQNIDFINAAQKLVLKKLEILEKFNRYITKAYYKFNEKRIMEELGLDVALYNYNLHEKLSEKIALKIEAWSNIRNSFKNSVDRQDLDEKYNHSRRQGYHLLIYLDSVKSHIEVEGLKSRIEKSIEMNELLYSLHIKILERKA